MPWLKFDEKQREEFKQAFNAKGVCQEKFWPYRQRYNNLSELNFLGRQDVY